MDFIQDALDFIKVARSFVPVFICVGVIIFILIKYNRNYAAGLIIRFPSIRPLHINSAIASLGLIAILNYWPNSNSQETEENSNQVYTWDSK